MAVQHYQFLGDIKAEFERLFPQEAEKVMPCSETDVVELERQLGLRLPQAYREFLRWMGRGGAGFWQGSDWRYENLPEINVWARSLLRDDHAEYQLPDDSCVFHWDPTLCFDFFGTNEGDDPPVYFYMTPDLEDIIRQSFRPADVPMAQSYLLYLFGGQKEKGFVVRSSTFSQCLLTEIKEFERIRNKLLGEQGGP